MGSTGLQMDLHNILRNLDYNLSLWGHLGNSEQEVNMIKLAFQDDHSGNSVVNTFEEE